jgi:hypothetical protein
MFLAELAKKGIKVKILRAKDDIFGDNLKESNNH